MYCDYDNLCSEVIYSKGDIEIIRCESEFDTIYTGVNNSVEAVRKYIQNPNLKIVRDYILNKK